MQYEYLYYEYLRYKAEVVLNEPPRSHRKAFIASTSESIVSMSYDDRSVKECMQPSVKESISDAAS